MKNSSLQAWAEIQSKLPRLLHMCLMATYIRSPITADEAHQLVVSIRPKTSYSAARSRFVELERMGLILVSGEREVRGGQNHTLYVISPLGIAVLHHPKVHDVLKVGMREQTAYRDSWKAEVRPFDQKWEGLMRRDLPVVVSKALLSGD